MARLGFESFVVEGSPSALDRRALPFELLTIAPLGLPAMNSGDGVPSDRGARKTASMLARRAFWTSLKRLAQTVSRSLPLAIHAAGLGANTLALARRVPRASLYYLHSPYQFPAVYLLSRRHGAPFVYDAHDFYEDTAREASRRSIQDRLLRKLDRAIEDRCVAAAEVIVTVSDGVGRLYGESFGRSAVIVRNAHDLRLDTPSVADVRTAAGIPADDFVVVVVGNAKREMAIKACVGAVELLPSRYHFVFVGRNYGLLRSLHARARRVHFIDAVPPTTVKSFIRSADAAAVPYLALHSSLLNALPNGFFHAVAAGLPLIYPPLPEVRGLAEEYGLGVCVDVATPASIAAGVRALAEDSKLLSECRHNARRAALELTWEQEERTLAEVLSAALGTGTEH